MKWITVIAFMLTLQAEASRLGPLAQMYCKDPKKPVEVTFNRAPSDHSLVTGSKRCSFRIIKSKYARRTDSLYFNYQLVTGKGVKVSDPQFKAGSLMKRGTFSFSFMGKKVLSSASVFENEHAVSCSGKSLNPDVLMKIGDQTSGAR